MKYQCPRCGGCESTYHKQNEREYQEYRSDYKEQWVYTCDYCGCACTWNECFVKEDDEY